MKLIHYRGLNCHLACVVSIADSLGVNYLNAFGTLWSETDFFDDQKYHIYSSKRIISNLAALGAKMEVLNCTSNKEAEESYSLIPEGELFVVGMDAFHIPWSPVYQNFHEPHYFFAQKNKLDFVCCFDPTYNQNHFKLMSADIIHHAFDLSRIHKLAVSPPELDISLEAREVLRKHPETQKEFLVDMNKYKAKQLKNITPLIKRVGAMINNRYLFQRFLHQYPFAFDHDRPFFDKAFLSRWEAVKNGVYKAYIVKNNESVIDEACGLFLSLMLEEIDMAKEI